MHSTVAPTVACATLICMRTTQRKGDIAVAQAIASFTALGADVAIPLTESAPYDLVVDVGRNIYRVQVKFTSSKEVDLRNIHSNASGYVVKKTTVNTYDWLYVLLADGTEYLVPQCLFDRRSITFYDNTYLLRTVFQHELLRISAVA